MKYTNKNQFQKRTIQPSEDSWAKLESRLTAFEHVKNNNKWTFLKYAASILIVLSAGFYFSQTTNKIHEDDVVVQPVLKVQEQKIQPIVEEPQNVLATLEEETSNKSVQKNKNNVSSKQTTEMAALKTVNKQEAIVNTQISGIESLENQKIKELVAVVESIKKEKGEVTDLEIEQLLVAAQKSLIAEHKKVQNKQFNGADLLAEVEYDLDKDFKKRLFEAIVNTLKEPKNIFVNRDN